MCDDVRNTLTRISGNSGGISNAVWRRDHDADLQDDSNTAFGTREAGSLGSTRLLGLGTQVPDFPERHGTGGMSPFR